MQTSGNIGISRRVYRKKLLPRVHAFGRGTDTVPAMLTPGEAVLVPGAADAVGRGTIKALNRLYAAGNERDDLLKEAEDTFYGGGHVQPSGPTPTPTPSPAPRKKVGRGRLDRFMPRGVLMAQEGDEWVDPEILPGNEGIGPFWPGDRPSTVAGGGTPGTYVPPPQGAGELVRPPDVPSIPFQLGKLPDWVKFVPGGQYALAGRNLFNLGSQAGSMAKNLFRGLRGMAADAPHRLMPPRMRSDAGGGYYDPQYLRSIGYEPGQGTGSLWPGVPQGGYGGYGLGGQGGSFFGQLAGVRGGPLAGSFAGLGAGGGGNIGSMGGLLFQHQALPALGGLNVLQAQRLGMLPNPNYSLAGVREFAGRVQPRMQ